MIIKANELRIGNLVNYPFGGISAIRDGGDIDTIYEAGGEGAQLTPEWLEKLGFKRGKEMSDRNVFYATGVHRAIYSINLNGQVMLHRAGSRIVLEHQIEYVHQLQNLYFALTGEELGIK